VGVGGDVVANDLDTFLAPDSLDARLAALAELIRDKSIHEAAARPGFQEALDELGKNAADPGLPDSERLLALAALARTAAVVKALRPAMKERFRKVLREPLPPIGLLSDPDDRERVAAACGVGDPRWAVPYLAEAVVEERSAEKARGACASALLEHAGNAQQWLEAVQGPWETYCGASTLSSITTRAPRILAVLRRSLNTGSSEAGADFSTALKAFLRVAVPRGTELRAKGGGMRLIESVATTTHQVLRSSFSLAADAATYDPVRVVMAKFPDYERQRLVERSEPLRLLRRDLAEAILLLARAGMTDPKLYARLELLASPEGAREIAVRLGNDAPGLSAEVREWLITGRFTAQARAPAETAAGSASDDQRFASLLTTAQRLEGLVGPVRRDALEELEFSAPHLAGALEALLGQANQCAAEVSAFAKQRGLKLRDAVGDIIEFSALEYEMVGDGRGLRAVRVVLPAVFGQTKAGVPVVVRRGLCEPE
jgi:hypothetical protein